MADIELVIKIPQDFYEFIKNHGTIAYGQRTLLFEAISNGTPQKTGYWVKKSQYGNDYCSECDYELLMCGKPKFCPNCGAKMESEDKNERSDKSF